MRGVATLRIPKDTIQPLRGGHPWVYRGTSVALEPGTVVRLVDDRDRIVAWGLADAGDIAVRVLGRGEPPSGPVERVVADRVLRADRVRARLLPPDTDAWRAVSAAGDGLPGLIVDRYGPLAVLRLYASAWEPWLGALVSAVSALPGVESVARRLGVERVDGREGLEHLAGAPVADTLVVREAGVASLVRPAEGQKTGLFLDQREHRMLIGRWAAGRVVANLFGYTGGFSVHAALGGAAQVTTVDQSPMAIEDARENFRLNGLNPDEHVFEVTDAFAWAPTGTVDLLIVDPPSLTHRKASDHAAGRAYGKLHRRLGAFVPRDGLLASSSCSARLSLDSWRRAVGEALATTGDWSWHWTSVEPTDHPTAVGHPEGAYLKFALLRRR